MKMVTQRKLIAAALALAAIITAASVLALLSSTVTIPSGGTITGVSLGVYEDAGFTTHATSIDWGTVTNGSSTNHIVYVRSEGKTVDVSLSLSTTNWSPSGISTYLTIDWDQPGHVLSPGDSVMATLTLTVDPDYTEGATFSVDIEVTGTQV